MDKTALIRDLNDTFRKTFVGGKIVLTECVDQLNDSDKSDLLGKVRTFDDFHHENDPHKEHDFVRIEHGGVVYYGKIDYYAQDMEGGSEDPSDPLQTVRVLTILRADEY